MKEAKYVEYNRANNDFSRKNKRNPTAAEQEMRDKLLKKKQLGYKFTRQKPLGPFIADFYCAKLKLVIEINGSSHNNKTTEDAERTNIINKLGIKVIRYTNQEIMDKINYVKQEIKKEIKTRKANLQILLPCQGEVSSGNETEGFVHSKGKVQSNTEPKEGFARPLMHQNLIDYSTNPEIKLSQLGQTQLNIGQQQVPDPKLLARIKKHNIGGHWHTESDFHYKYKAIKPKVKLYYYQGNISLLHQKILAIVGPRRITPYAQKVLDNLFNQAKTHKLVTISGLAPGVDQYAHRLSIQHKIPTIAVLGGGIKRFREHKDRNLMQEIIDNDGLILSEFKLNFKPTNYSFPQRNRIVAGLSDALFIPEAGKKSGSLVTANFALDMKKPIYGTPNDIFSHQHQGLHEYMQQNKISISLDHTIFLQKHFGTASLSPAVLRGRSKEEFASQFQGLPPTEQKLLKLFREHNKLNHKQLIQLTNLPIHQLSNTLSILEIKGLIFQQSPGIFAKN